MGVDEMWRVFSQNEICNYHTTQQLRFRACSPEKRKLMFTQKPVHECSQGLYLSQPQTGSSPDALGQVSGQTYRGCLRGIETTERNELLIHQMTWVDLYRVMPSRKKTPSQKVTYGMIPFM